MAASEIQDGELRTARHWVWVMMAVGAAAFALGIRAAQPVVFVHAENAEKRSKTNGEAEKGTQPQEPAETGETDRTQMLPWLYLMKR